VVRFINLSRMIAFVAQIGRAIGARMPAVSGRGAAERIGAALDFV
jgi:hypothetical protein